MLTKKDIQVISDLLDVKLEEKLEEKFELKLKDIREDISELKADVINIKRDVNTIKDGLDTIKIDLTETKNKVNYILDTQIKLVSQFTRVRDDHEVRIAVLEEEVLN